MEIKQIPLSFGLRDDATFASFYAQDKNIQAKQCIYTMATGDGEQFAYLYGNSGTGKTHLLQAAVNIAYEHRKTSLYLTLKNIKTLTCEQLKSLNNINLVCIDDIDFVCGNNNWEESLFHLYNQLKENNGKLIISSKHSPQHIKITLADLKSRLSWGISYNLQMLTDEEKIIALRSRAKVRGINLDDKVCNFLFNHLPRDMQQIFSLLDKLDQASLVEKRKITVPFVKEILA